MKILTISHRNTAFASLSPQEQNHVMISALEAVLATKKKKGDKYSIYAAAGWGRSISIGDYDSLEEYYQTLQTEALQRSLSDFECYPLIEADEQTLENMLKQMKA
jgi:hypothetical protein